MSAPGPCKGCRASVHVSEDSIRRMLEHLINREGASLMPDEEYAARLQYCRACDKFVYGTTCQVCGCLIPVKARLVGKHCPAGKWSEP